MTFTTNTQAAHPFQALDGFVRAHLLRVNYAIVASSYKYCFLFFCTVSTDLDFEVQTSSMQFEFELLFEN